MAKDAVTGAVASVWIGQDGQLAGPPPSRSQVLSQARLAAAVAVAGLGLFLAAVGRVASVILDWRRLASWQAEWSVTGPLWTRGR
jgi:hypothetical protein